MGIDIALRKLRAPTRKSDSQKMLLDFVPKGWHNVERFHLHGMHRVA